jgi:S-adenosylmethionine decarboxylase
MAYWGYHMMVNAKNCLAPAIRSSDIIRGFSQRLVRDIDMVPYGEPQVVMFGTGNKKGYTLVQLIETSNICAHFVEESNDMYLDVFSCKPFEVEIVQKVMNEVFYPEKMETQFFTRDARML